MGTLGMCHVTEPQFPPKGSCTQRLRGIEKHKCLQERDSQGFRPLPRQPELLCRGSQFMVNTHPLTLWAAGCICWPHKCEVLWNIYSAYLLGPSQSE